MNSKYRHHTDEQLLLELRASHKEELGQQARLLRILEEIDRRSLHVEMGFPSLFQFCTGLLFMSEHEAYLRMTVARTARRFPVIFAMIERGELHLSAVAKLAPCLEDENHRSLLEAAVHKTKREVEEIVAAAFPKPDVAPSIRLLKTPLPPTPPASTPAPLFAPRSVEQRPTPKPETPHHTMTPLAPNRYAIRFTASTRCRDLLDRAQDLMSHRSPKTDPSEIIEEALAVLVEKLEKEKFKKTSRPRPETTEPTTPRHIPAEVKRTVHARDGGRCTYVGPEGHRCTSTAFVEFDHIVPVAKGGKSTADNLRLRCHVHNEHAARQEFGDQHMTLFALGFRPIPNGQNLGPDQVASSVAVREGNLN